MQNALLVTQMLLQFLAQVNSAAQLLSTAQAENRDVTDDELNTLQANYQAAHAQLDKDIASG